MPATRKTTGKRTKLTNRSGTHFVRRRADGTFKDEVSVGRSLAQDRRRRGRHTAEPGQGDRGDRAR